MGVVLGVAARKGFPTRLCLPQLAPAGPFLASTILVPKKLHLLQQNCSSLTSAENSPVSSITILGIQSQQQEKKHNRRGSKKASKDAYSNVGIFYGCLWLFTYQLGQASNDNLVIRRRAVRAGVQLSPASSNDYHKSQDCSALLDFSPHSLHKSHCSHLRKTVCSSMSTS